jgi:hypothetical protein
MPKNVVGVLLFSTLLCGMSCRTQEVAEVDDQEDAATTATEQEVPGVDQPGDLNPVEAQTMVDDVTIGKEVGADGMIPAEDQGDDFAPGETVYLVMNVGDAGAGTPVKVVWYGPGERKISEQVKDVPAGDAYLSFQSDEAPDKGFWATGDYRAEVWIGDEKVNTQQFQIVDPGEAGQ